MPQPNDRIGPYTLVRQLGRGACGAVWLAERRTALATTQVAIKLLVDEAADLDEIARESQMWARAGGHPNVLPIIEADIYDGQVAIVSEYAPDGSLQAWMAQHGGMAPSVASAIEMTVGILDGLEHLHARRIVHRDLKPANILLLGDTPRLADFGLARVLRTDVSTASIAGTPAYMAPETFDGARSERSDIWAVGVILYQLLAGRFPFPRTNIAQLLGAIVTRDPEPLPASVPQPLRAAVARALRKDPAERFQSAGEMRAAVSRARGTLGAGASPAAVVADVIPPGDASAARAPIGATVSPSVWRDRRTATVPVPLRVPVPLLARPAVWAGASLAVILGVGSFYALHTTSRPDLARAPQEVAGATVREAAGPAARDSRVDAAPARESATPPEAEPTSAPAPVSSVGPGGAGMAPAPAPPARVMPGGAGPSGPGFDISGTWEYYGGCDGSRLRIDAHGGVPSISGEFRCGGPPFEWTAFDVRWIGPNQLMYRTEWQGGVTITCKIEFRSGTDAHKGYMFPDGRSGGMSLRKVA